MVLDKEKLLALWDKVQQYPQVFDDFSIKSLQAFYNTMMAPTNQFYEFGNLDGLGAFMSVRPGLDAIIHLVMFDRKLRGREPVFHQVLFDFMRRAKLRRVTAMIPGDNPMAIKLALRLGFQKEGVLRESLLRDGRYLDMHVLGMLREELIDAIAAQSERSAAV